MRLKFTVLKNIDYNLSQYLQTRNAMIKPYGFSNTIALSW